MAKRILFINHASNLSGAPKSLSYLIRYSIKNHYDTHVLNINKGPSDNLFRKEGATLKFQKYSGPFHGSLVAPSNWQLVLRNFFFLIPTIVLGYFSIRKVRPEIIHLNSSCLFGFAISSKLYNRHIPVICHIREPICPNWLGWPLRYFNNKFVDGFIAISGYDLKSIGLGKTNKKKATIVVHNVATKIAPRPHIKTNDMGDTLGLNNNSFVMLYLARFAEGNGWEELIKTFRKLHSERPECHLILAGAEEGVDYTQYQSENIHILTFANDVSKLLKSCDLFVCPFTQPHFSRGLIEAASMGIPSLARNIECLDELVTHEVTGYLYNSDSEFINYSKTLISSPALLGEMGENARTVAKEKFEYHKNSAEIFNFFEQFTSKKDAAKK